MSVFITGTDLVSDSLKIANGTSNSYEEYVKKLTTTNATTTSVYSLTTTSNSVINMRAEFTFISSTDSGVVNYNLKIANIAGTITVKVISNDSSIDSALTGITAIAVASGN